MGAAERIMLRFEHGGLEWIGLEPDSSWKSYAKWKQDFLKKGCSVLVWSWEMRRRCLRWAKGVEEEKKTMTDTEKIHECYFDSRNT